MLGCLTLPIRLAAVLLMVIGGYVLWTRRDRIEAFVHGLTDRSAATIPAAVGRPTERALRSGQAKVDSLNGWRADSVVLTADEAASLVGAGLDQRLRGGLDSLTIQLGEGRIEVGARIRTAGLPKDALGPFADAVDPWEPIRGGGALAVTAPGRATWTVDAFRVRDFDFPREALPRIVGLVTGRKAGAAVTVAIPKGIGGLRVHPGGVTVYPSGQAP